MADARDDKLKQFQAALAELQLRFKTELPARLAGIRAQIETFVTEGLDATTREDLQRQIHSLTGSGTTFGAPELTRTSRELEKFYRAHLAPLERPDEDRAAQLWQYFDGLIQAAAQFIDPLGLAGTRASPGADEPRQTVIFSQDDATAELMQIELSLLGIDSISMTRDTLPQGPIDLLIVDLDGVSQPLDFFAGWLPGMPGAPARMVCLSKNADVSTRLIAARLGAQAFLHKPVLTEELTDLMQRLDEGRRQPGYRVLIVDDERQLAEYYALVLQEAGMHTAVVTGPVHMFEKLAEFRPELIVLDLYLPGWNGLEIASVIRQQSTYVSIPIVFLSSDQTASSRLDAMRRGADDFLVKPIDPHYLVTAIQCRAARYRALREQMTRDGLTRALNRNAVMQLLEIEESRCRRNSQPLTVAMLDIDDFKLGNDQYGHQAGDQVLRALCSLLRQRLRASDAIGRYGGEEFLLVLPNTSQSDAIALVEALRARFVQIRFPFAMPAVAFSFSAGISTLRAGETVEGVVGRAEQSLVLAKEAGRNRVFTSFE
ncbi:diguanylate cyclase [Amantichitinum ursilacus]|uniref:diguanylate cyclase n=1 Tax=Amantichitinum ursilacus TaxID=857265 RepID=A0A0N0XFL7_9NEIS|nr:diguanylate cyclase [Amantichitinum ursilacus]KPC49211.1 Response regulator PleD [Amantichitinum ursilacus]